MGKVNIIRNIEKGLQHTWRRRITSLKLYSQLSHTAAHTSRAAALGSYSLFLSSRISLFFSSLLSKIYSLSMPIYR